MHFIGLDEIPSRERFCSRSLRIEFRSKGPWPFEALGRAPVSYRFAVESSLTQARRLCSVAQFDNNSADFHILSTERQKTMSALPSRRAQEHRRPRLCLARAWPRNQPFVYPLNSLRVTDVQDRAISRAFLGGDFGLRRKPSC